MRHPRAAYSVSSESRFNRSKAVTVASMLYSTRRSMMSEPSQMAYEARASPSNEHPTLPGLTVKVVDQCTLKGTCAPAKNMMSGWPISRNIASGWPLTMMSDSQGHFGFSSPLYDKRHSVSAACKAAHFVGPRENSSAGGSPTRKALISDVTNLLVAACIAFANGGSMELQTGMDRPKARS